MKRRSVALFVVVVSLVVAACDGGSVVTGGVDRSLTDLAGQYTAAWGSGDPASVAAFFAADGSLTVNDGEPAVGQEAIEGVAEFFMTALPDMVLYFDGLEEEANGRVQFHWTLAATNSGPDGNGNKVRVSGYESWRLNEDGLIAESQGHFPSAEYERQLEVGYDGPVREIGVMRFPDGEVQHVVRAAATAWRPCPPSLPPGCELAVLEGDPRGHDLFTVRFRVAESFVMPPHTHPRDERVTIVSGRAAVAFGAESERSDAIEFGPGDYYVNARDAEHQVWIEGPTVLQITGIGPWKVQPIAMEAPDLTE